MIDTKALRDAAEKATPGPWRWEVSLKGKSVTLEGGKPTFDRTVMSFTRWGLGCAAPEFAVDGILTHTKELTAIVPGREHHQDWFRDINHPDAQYIALANPQTILRLLDVVEAAKESFERIGCKSANCTYCTAAECRHKILGQKLAALDGTP